MDYNDPKTVAYWEYAKEFVRSESHCKQYADLCGVTVRQFKFLTPRELLAAFLEHQGHRIDFNSAMRHY